jgi:hypothetical protein
VRKEELLFCEQKRSKKNFAPLARAGGAPGGPLAKVFCFFFSKKKRFLSKGVDGPVKPGHDVLRPAQRFSDCLVS